jgi:polyisoprenyl-teichoic acid--peptidoglycan teichoic acid transferase
VYAGYLVKKTDHFLEKISSGPSELNAPFAMDEQDKDSDLSAHQLLQSRTIETARPKAITFLLLGIDNRKQTRSMNSDVIMAVAINPNGKSATVVSLPRDMQLNPSGLPARKANYYFPYYYNIDQSTAFARTKQLFSQVFDMPIRYTAAFHFKGFEQIVDKLGGVTVDVDMNMRYVDREDGTNINLQKGTQLLNGKQALDFVRYRKSNRNTKDSSDYMRNQRQHQVLHQVAGKIKSMNGIAHMGSVLDTAGNYIKTDIPSSEIRGMMESLLNIDRDQIKFISLQGEWKSPYVRVKEEDFNQAKRALQEEIGG